MAAICERGQAMTFSINEYIAATAGKAKCTKIPPELQEGDFFDFLRILSIFFKVVLRTETIQGE
jgi:hypothetical protein